MSQSTKYINQHLALLRNHLQEWRTLVGQETQAREAVVAKHHLERDYTRPRVNALDWARYLTQYTERLIKLAVIYQHRRQAMRSRQEQEMADLYHTGLPAKTTCTMGLTG